MLSVCCRKMVFVPSSGGILNISRQNMFSYYKSLPMLPRTIEKFHDHCVAMDVTKM